MEFHAIVLCGRGAKLSPFSTAHPSGMPKALLPIFNKPMVQHVLEWCDNSPFKDISLVVDASSKDLLQEFLNNYESNIRNKQILSFVNKINIVSINAKTTGEILASLINLNKINSDFAILPCDFITDLPAQVLIEQFRIRDVQDVSMCCFYNNSLSNIPTHSNNFKNYYTLYESQNNHNNSNAVNDYDYYQNDSHLVDLITNESIEISKFLQIRTQMLWRFPNIEVSKNLLNSFIFFNSLELVNILKHSITVKKYKINEKSITTIFQDLAKRSWKHKKPLEKINLFILPKQSTFIRSNTLQLYLESNRWLMKENLLKNPSIRNQLQSQAQKQKEKGAPTIGVDSLLGQNTTVDKMSTIKKTIIGDNCQIGKKCRLNGSLVFNNVIIGDNVILENSIVGHNVILESNGKYLSANIENNFSKKNDEESDPEIYSDSGDDK
ncbi:translation initiation factor eIF2B subunit gamma ASCRUDRAFT_6379 [Ascoidea rubescens DSM 1968]|uniref:Translation initiation factor eIF2B subunit gamma n=1 Tax=Ascoidea rubescens DSM 1968 TaxID=1344418 RepID=A0A1D2VM63_9ASCO|nr:hypothetical protein ASCRUDRAFT_6379 [Ascoidea rubescens DSM 1968]ODV62706.1 hypothetical protein ASCRUDRAFT_6379 [Ascoidea rubescens DSM 1968]